MKIFFPIGKINVFGFLPFQISKLSQPPPPQLPPSFYNNIVVDDRTQNNLNNREFIDVTDVHSTSLIGKNAIFNSYLMMLSPLCENIWCVAIDIG